MVHFKRSNSGTPDCGKPRDLRLWRGALRRIRTRSNGAGLPRMRDDMIGWETATEGVRSAIRPKCLIPTPLSSGACTS
jgi:hypothetical protein